VILVVVGGCTGQQHQEFISKTILFYQQKRFRDWLSCWFFSPTTKKRVIERSLNKYIMDRIEGFDDY